MNFTQFLLILKARALIALLALGVTVATTVVVSMMLPKSYTATTTLIVDAKAKDPVTGMLLPAQLIPGYMATQVDVIQSQNVALKVIDALKLADNPTVKADFMAQTQGQGSIRHWLADLLLKKLEVRPSRESSVIQLSFSGTDPRFAAIVANTFAQTYIHTNLELKVEPARQTSAWYDETLKTLRTALEEAQANLTNYQREKGLQATDERLDIETARLAELSSQLVAAQAQTFETTSRQRQSANALAEVELNPLVQNLKAELARAEANLTQIGERLDRNHPHFIAAQAQAEAVRQRLDAEMRLATRTVTTTAKVAQNREGDIRAALATQRARVMSLKQQRDEASVLQRDMENAHRAYDLALQRQHQSTLEAQSNQTDIAVLNPAVPPVQASSPKILLNTLLAIFLGGLLGIGLAFLMEMIDRRVRSGEDLAAALDIPVLGEISKFKQPGRWSLRRQPS